MLYCGTKINVPLLSLLAIVLIGTQSKTAIEGLVGAIVLVSLFKVSQTRLRAILCLLPLIVLAVTLPILAYASTRPDWAIPFVGTLTGRAGIWDVTLAQWAQSPFLGDGLRAGNAQCKWSIYPGLALLSTKHTTSLPTR